MILTTEEEKCLDSAIAHIGNEINNLQSKKALLLRKANMHKAFINSLPPEVLTTIFQYVSIQSSKAGLQQILKLATVSYHWNQIIHSFPHFWDSVVLHANATYPNVLNHLKICSENARFVPLFICIFLHSHHYHLTAMELLQFTLSNLSQKIYSLQLHNIDKTIWTSMSALAKDIIFPQLESLELQFTPKTKFITAKLLFHMPQLTKLILVNPMPGIHHQLPVQNLSTLKIENTSLAQTLHILVQCPDLTLLSFHGNTTHPHLPVSSHITGAIALKKLKFMELNIECIFDMDIISQIHAPSIQKLVWNVVLFPQAGDYQKPFFTKIHNMKAITLPYVQKETEAILSMLPSLTKVDISLDFRWMENLLNILGKKHSRQNTILPQLTELYILTRSFRCPDKQLHIIWDRLIKMLQFRRKFSANQDVQFQKFVLKAELKVKCQLWPKELSGFKKLAKEGMKISIANIDF